MTHILVAPDSFKDCLSSFEVARLICERINETQPGLKTTMFPMADGGEGTIDCVHFHKGGVWRKLTVHDPLNRKIESSYLIVDEGKTAIIELAKASGLELLGTSERNALATSSYGAGELVRDAVEMGIRKIILALGGSATVDAGTGIAAALGFRFYSKSGTLIAPCGANLTEIHAINAENIHPILHQVEFVVAADVQNTLNGPAGAARVFAPQKGAGSEGVAVLEKRLMHISKLLEKATSFNPDLHPGTGAAGGAALFLMAYGNCKIEKGFDVIARLTGFYNAVSKADVIISGEGKIDVQTGYGKVLSSIAGIVKSEHKVLIALAGTIKGDRAEIIKKFGLQQLFVLDRFATNRDDSIKNAAKYLKLINFEF